MMAPISRPIAVRISQRLIPEGELSATILVAQKPFLTAAYGRMDAFCLQQPGCLMMGWISLRLACYMKH